MQNDGLLQLVSDRNGALAAGLDDLHAHVAAAVLQRTRNCKADIAAARENDALRRRFLMAEQAQGSGNLRPVGNHVGEIADPQLIGRVRREHAVVSPDSDDGRSKIREEFGKLLQRRVHERAVLAAFDRDHRHAVLREANRVRRARKRDTAQHHAPDLELGRDHDIDRHVLAGEERLVLGQQVALRPHPRDLARHVEDRVRELARHHVHLVVQGDGD